MPIVAADQIVQRTTKDRLQSELPLEISAFTHLIERLHRKFVQRCPQVHPPGHHFFRPEVLLAADANFLYLSAPRPIWRSDSP